MVSGASPRPAPTGVKVTFTADHLLPTSDLVIARTQGAPLATTIQPGKTVSSETAKVLSERWQIAPFAAAQVQVTVATVAGRADERRMLGLGDASSPAPTRARRSPGRPARGTTSRSTRRRSPRCRPTRCSGRCRAAGRRRRSISRRSASPCTGSRRRPSRSSRRSPIATARPTRARRQMPKDGALVYILESLETHAKLPPRPAHFTVGRVQNYECLGPGVVFHWRESGRALQANVLLGPKAGKQRRAQVERLLDSLVVQAHRPAARADRLARDPTRTPTTRCGSRPAGRPARCNTRTRRRVRARCSGSRTRRAASW